MTDSSSSTKRKDLGDEAAARGRGDAEDGPVKRKGSIKTYILEALGTFSENAQALLASAKKDAAGYSTDEFVSSKVSQVGALIGYYSDLFTQCDVLTRKSLDKLLEANFRYPEIQDSYEELLEFEDEYTVFLDEVDKKLQEGAPSDVTSVGDEGPIDVAISDVNEDRQTTLKHELSGKSLVMVLLRHFA